MEKLEIRAVIKYFSKKGMPPKKIHESKEEGKDEDFMETLGKESPSYSTVKKWAAEVKKGRESVRMMDGLATLKMPRFMKMSRSCIPWLCMIGGETC